MTKERSPNYPNCSLDEAVDKISTIFDHAGRTKVTADDLAKALGYSGLNGASRTALSPLTAYNLLTRHGRSEYVVSDIALGIIHPSTNSERRAFMKQAALGPSLFKKLHETSDGCSQAILKNKLIRDSGFTPDGASKAAAVYFKNLPYMEYDPSEDALSDDQEELTPTSPEPEQSKGSPNTSTQILSTTPTVDDYTVSISGPKIQFSVIVSDETDLMIIDAMLKKVKTFINEENKSE